MRCIDSHQHFWTLARGDYDWLTPDLAPLYRDFGPSDLAPLLADRVDATVLVQAAPSESETRFLLEIAAHTPFVACVVGWADLEAPDAGLALEELAEEDALVGVRPMIQDLPDPAWMLRDTVEPAWLALAHHRLRLDALVRPEHLHALHTLLGRHPGLRVVIDHAAKPVFGGDGFEDWAADLSRIARDTDACCKLSGLLTEAPPGAGAAELRPWVDFLLERFGPERLMWGSDWPVLNLASSYDAWFEMSATLLEPLSADERAAVMGGTAGDFYGI